MTDEASLLPPVAEIVREAGRHALEIRESRQLRTELKTDGTPVTNADLWANTYISTKLSELTPSVPVVSEESLENRDSRLKVPDVWLVDPLDGTKEFVTGSPDFTINIGLIRKGRPVLGAVYAPAHGVLYYGAENLGAFKQLGDKEPRRITTGRRQRRPVVAVSRSHQNDQTRAYLAGLGRHRTLALGSSLKLCYVADGTADLYPRLSPCMEWDTAAADAVVRAAGGQVLDYETRKPLTYNKPDLHNPYFIVQGKVWSAP